MSYLDLIDNAAADKPVASLAIYAATDMTIIEISDDRASQDIIIENVKHYRRLTPEYWAWFRHKYLLMEDALSHGKISEETFVEILNRISILYNHAIALFGKEMLDNAMRTTNVRELDEIVRQKTSVNTNSPETQICVPAHSLVFESKRNARGK